jgi:hypothetical protein
MIANAVSAVHFRCGSNLEVLESNWEVRFALKNGHSQQVRCEK